MVEARDQLARAKESRPSTAASVPCPSPTWSGISSSGTRRVYVVEQNRDAQVTSILKSTLSGALADRLVPITHYNGTPIAAENIVRPILGWEKNPSGPGMAHRRRRARQSARSSRRRSPPNDRAELLALEPPVAEAFSHTFDLRRGDETMASRSDDSGPEQRPHRSRCRPWPFRGCRRPCAKGADTTASPATLIEACKSTGVNPYATVKMSGIGCSSKTPAYFLQASHGFNALHGRMPSVATGAMVANSKLLCIGISGDGDTANIGMGQFKHICRRNVPIVYIIENNGCYGLTKGQFSATADSEPAPAAADRRDQRHCPRSTCASRRSWAAHHSWRGRSPATRSRWSRC